MVTPDTTPVVAPTVAMAVLLLAHVPLVGEPVRVIVEDGATVYILPLIVGDTLTVIDPGILPTHVVTELVAIIV